MEVYARPMRGGSHKPFTVCSASRSMLPVPTLDCHPFPASLHPFQLPSRSSPRGDAPGDDAAGFMMGEPMGCS